MEEHKKLLTGQTVWFKDQYSRGPIKEHEITHVGRKYFTAGRTKFFIDTMLEDTKYGSPAQAYHTLQEYEDICLHYNLVRAIQGVQYWSRLDLATLQEIHDKIKQYDPSQG